jgi:hypothetical protein
MGPLCDKASLREKGQDPREKITPSEPSKEDTWQPKTENELPKAACCGGRLPNTHNADNPSSTSASILQSRFGVKLTWASVTHFGFVASWAGFLIGASFHLRN